MILRRWDIIFVPAGEHDSAGHPAIVLSHERILGSPRFQRVNVLMGTKKQPAENAAEHHVLLDSADGLEFLTLFDCSFLYIIRKSEILRSSGYVSFERRKEIQRKIRAFFGLG